MREPRVCYHSDTYQSHKRAAGPYQEVIASHFETATQIQDANIVILHREPHNFKSLYEQIPLLRDKYVISYAVWEAYPLPAEYARSLSLVQEVWTCSEYCRKIIAEHHDNVRVIPHIVERDPQIDDIDSVLIKRLVNFTAERFYFLCIARTLGFRKNLDFLVDTFLSIAPEMPSSRLLIKSLASDPKPSWKHPQVELLPLTLSDSQINVLYSLANAYVSAHHSEGWGLTLSDAMLLGIPVIATGYSGNLEFMDSTNSFLIDAKEAYIDPSECIGKFTPEMKWGIPDGNMLASVMKGMYDGTLRNEALVRSREARESCRRFSRQSVAELLIDRIKAISVSA